MTMQIITGKHNNYRITIEELSVKEDCELQTMQLEIEDREICSRLLRRSNKTVA